MFTLLHLQNINDRDFREALPTILTIQLHACKPNI